MLFTRILVSSLTFLGGWGGVGVGVWGLGLLLWTLANATQLQQSTKCTNSMALGCKMECPDVASMVCYSWKGCLEGCWGYCMRMAVEASYVRMAGETLAAGHHLC